MRPETRNLVLVIAVGLALKVWTTFGPFIVSDGPFHFSVTPQNAAINLAFGLMWVAILALTYRRDPAGRLWRVLLLVFVAEGTWVIQFLGGDLTWALSEFFGPLGAVVMLHLVLAFPTGHFADRFDRWLLGILYAIVLPIRLLSFLVWDPAWVDCLPTDFCPANPFMIVRNDSLYEVLGKVGLASPAFAVLAAIETIRHWRRASPAMRRVIAPVALGMPLVFLVQGIWWLAPTIDRDDIRVFMLENKVFDVPSYLTPALFLMGTLQIRLARGSLADLAVALGGGVPLGGLRDALARTLRDPTLQLAFAAPAGDGLVDSTGQPFEVPLDAKRATTRLERDGELLAVMVHDPALISEDRGFLEAVGSVARLALENERLSAQVQAQLEEVRASRQRIVEAGDAERRRVERDLHDGAQQRLVALAMRLEAARGSTREAEALIDATTAELGTAIAEVRNLARGLHPPILTEAGVRAAIDSLAERLPVPVEVDADDRRYHAQIEAAAYFVVAEALTNVVRYAAASHARVAIRRHDDGLVIEVRDDGRGGADPVRGSGLRGLEDRVAALGGSLEVESPVGAGTTVRARLPLEGPGA